MLLAGLALLGVIALPALHMKLGLPDGGSQPTSSTERRAYDLLTDGFGPGFNGPLTVVVDAPGPRASPSRSRLANGVVEGLEEHARRRCGRAGRPERGRRPHDRRRSRRRAARRRMRRRTSSTLIRDKADEVPAQTGVEAYVTGTTALNIDTADQLERRAAALHRGGRRAWRCCC